MPHPHAGPTRHPEVPRHSDSPARCLLFPIRAAVRVYSDAFPGRPDPEGSPTPTPAPWPCSLSGLLTPLLAFPRPSTSPILPGPQKRILPCWLHSVLGPGQAALGPRGAQLSLSSRKYQRADPAEAERGSRGRRREESAADAKPRVDQGRIGCWGGALGTQSLPGA